MRTEAGPPVASDLPVPRKRPVPIVPPIAIICTWRAESLRARRSARMGWRMGEGGGEEGKWSRDEVLGAVEGVLEMFSMSEDEDSMVSGD